MRWTCIVNANIPNGLQKFETFGFFLACHRKIANSITCYIHSARADFYQRGSSK